MARRVAAYFVYADGTYEGETKTLAGAHKSAAQKPVTSQREQKCMGMTWGKMQREASKFNEL